MDPKMSSEGAELHWATRLTELVPLSARRAVFMPTTRAANGRRAKTPLRAASENGASRCANLVRQLKPESG